MKNKMISEKLTHTVNGETFTVNLVSKGIENNYKATAENATVNFSVRRMKNCNGLLSITGDAGYLECYNYSEYLPLVAKKIIDMKSKIQIEATEQKYNILLVATGQLWCGMSFKEVGNKQTRNFSLSHAEELKQGFIDEFGPVEIIKAA